MSAPPIDTRSRLLEVAAQVYAECGYRGTTTRRIAQDAGVNEVTLFRQFGSKDALLREAIERADHEGRDTLDAGAEDPVAELHRWAFSTCERLYAFRNLIRQVMGDLVAFPAIAPRVCDDTSHEVDQLDRFLQRLAERGVITAQGPERLEAAAAMLFHGLLGHALWRDIVPDIPPADACIRQFVELTLRALGATHTDAPGVCS